jgi:hypothetical protein
MRANTLVSSTDTSIVIEWIPGYNGGDEQTFNIQYRIINESKIWTTQEIPKYIRQNYTLVGLPFDLFGFSFMFIMNVSESAMMVIPETRHVH